MGININLNFNGKYSATSPIRGKSPIYTIIKQQVSQELKAEKEREYEQHLKKMIQKYCPDEEFKQKIMGG